MTQYIEDMIPGVKQGGLNTNSAVDFSGASSVALPSGATIGGSSVVALAAITSTSATALTVASTSTNYGLQVDESTGSAITGLKIKAAATGNGVALSALGGTNEGVKLDGKGTGTVGINTVSTTSGLTTIGNTTALGGAFVNGPLTFSNKVLASSGNTTITAAMSGAVMLFDGSSVTYTLPTGVVGMTYTFLSSVVSSTTQKIITTSGDFFTGTITVSTAAGTPATYMAVGNGSSHLAITQNGTTTGGGVGSIVTVVCYAANKWNAFGQVIGTGSNASPFATS